MWDKFGEFDTFSEINELAENLFNEGDLESIRVLAQENGIPADLADLSCISQRERHGNSS